MYTLNVNDLGRIMFVELYLPHLHPPVTMQAQACAPDVIKDINSGPELILALGLPCGLIQHLLQGYEPTSSLSKPLLPPKSITA